MTKCKLSPWALGLALGTLWGASVLLVGFLAFMGLEGGFLVMLHKLHPGHNQTIVTLLVAAGIEFVSGLVHGVVIAWLYNVFAEHCCNKGGKCA